MNKTRATTMGALFFIVLMGTVLVIIFLLDQKNKDKYIEKGEIIERHESYSTINIKEKNLRWIYDNEEKELSLFITVNVDGYKESDDLIEDLKKCLSGDDYQPENKRDVCIIMVGNIPNLWTKKSLGDWTIELISGIHPKNCWKIGYEVRSEAGDDDLPEYDIEEATIRFILSKLKFTENKLLNGLKKPNSNILEIKNEDKLDEYNWK